MKKYICKMCGMDFDVKNELEDHNSKIHGMKFECSECGVVFSSKEELKNHKEKTHAP